MVDKVKREIAVMRMIRHKHVVQLLDLMQSASKIYMVMELVTGGELFYVLGSLYFPYSSPSHLGRYSFLVLFVLSFFLLSYSFP